MAGPWEKYAPQNAAPGTVPTAQPAAPAVTQSEGPWSRYASVDTGPEATTAPVTGPGAGGSSAEAFAGNLGAGFGKTVLSAQGLVGKGLRALGAEDAGNWLVNDAEQGRKNLDAQTAAYRAESPIASTLGNVGGELVATLPVAGALGAGVKAAGATRLGDAIATGGLSAGGAGIGTRVAGGAIAGGATAGLVNPADAGTGAAIGAVLPPAVRGLGLAGRAVGGLVQPFFGAGQDAIVGRTLREFATDAQAARGSLSRAAQMVPGSAPTVAQAAGDVGLAGLARTMQSASPEFAAELAARQTAQNQARTAALEGIAGNTGRLDIAKNARDTLTGPMRDRVLSDAGQFSADGVLSGIDGLLANPNNAGNLAQQALGQFRNQIARFTDDAGNIDARALYAIRKDINEVLGGKLQGEAGNLRYASGQLSAVKGLIDDAIDQASRRVPTSTSSAVGRPLSSLAQGQAGAGSGVTNAAARTSWRDYLQTYARESVPINQMERLDDILKSVQTGTVDAQGGAILSTPKLNNLLKNKGDELARELSPQQLDILRRVQADLNSSQLAANAGRAVGSNTVQNLAQTSLLQRALGERLGGSSLVQSTLGRLAQIPYGTANKQIQERLGQALLNPNEAARLLAEPQPGALSAIARRAALAGRAAPVALTSPGQ